MHALSLPGAAGPRRGPAPGLGLLALQAAGVADLGGGRVAKGVRRGQGLDPALRRERRRPEESAGWRWCLTVRISVAGHWNPDYAPPEP